MDGMTEDASERKMYSEDAVRINTFSWGQEQVRS